MAVRRAVPADAAGIAHVHVQAWREAYTGRMPQSILDRLDEERLTRTRAESLEHEQLPYGGGDGAPTEGRAAASEPGPVATWVAVHAGEIVGWAVSGPSRDDAPPTPRELYAIYVLAAHHGSGAGRALLDAAIGRGPASLWVLADNPRARAFYARNGFRPDGAAKDDTGWGATISEVRLVRR
ncbi:GNAT family N-acetyltransferase [Microbacterium oleivorans]|uniref:GNAT family N-acetyltransferase n=1 Tax=Microbacterium oleivorans TaxID=273677 RepID=UPI004038AAD3